MRTLVGLAVAALLLMLTACSSGKQSTYPYEEGFGSTTQAGLALRNGSCINYGYRMVASGTIHETNQASSQEISITFAVMFLGVNNRVERTVNYPSPETTGADVPFTIALDTGQQAGMGCDIEVGWAG